MTMETPDDISQQPTTSAAMLYMSDRHGLAFEEVARLSGYSVADIRIAYPVMADLLRGYYAEAWQRYVDMESSVPEFGTYTLAEKLATLIFSYVDELEAVTGFAQKTYRHLYSGSTTMELINSEITERIEQYLASDDYTSFIVKYFPSRQLSVLIQKAISWLIAERIYDQSPDKERSSALIDKTCTLIQSCMYTGAVDHAIDFLKYVGMTYRSNTK